MPPEVVKAVRCGLGKFELDANEVVTQYDHTGAVVGIFSASDTPNLRSWLASEQPRELGGPKTIARSHE